MNHSNFFFFDQLDLKHLSHIEKKVFFINIYNLLMMHIHLLIGPPSTKFKRSIYFKSFSYNIDKHNYSLDDIKNGILRGDIINSFHKELTLLMCVCSEYSHCFCFCFCF
jgi:hypothetical protein